MSQSVLTEIKTLLSQYTGKKHIYLVKRGNDAILQILTRYREQYPSLTIPDQAGWMTYKQYGEKLSFDITEIKTSSGVFSGKFDNTLLLINSQPAYAFELPLENITATNSLCVNDVSSSIGTKAAFWGDLCVGSFGRWKPLNVGKGGFIASPEPLDIQEEEFPTEELALLLQKLKTLPKRLDFLGEKSHEVKEDLSGFEILYPGHKGVNVIVRFSSEEEKEILIDYCEYKNLEYTECPRGIRVLEPAISIEVKRLE